MELEFRRFRHHFSEQQSPKAKRSQLLQHLRGNPEKVALRLGYSNGFHRLLELGAADELSAAD
jgi:uncharacterized membrane protein